MPRIPRRFPTALFGGVFLAVGLASWSAAGQPTDLDDLLDGSRAAQKAGRLEQAEQLALSAIAEAEKIGSRTAQGKALDALGRVLTELNRYEEAEQSLQRALGLLEPLGTTAELGHVQHRLSLTYRYRADYGTALEWLRRSEQTFRELRDQDGLQDVYNSFGVVYDFLGQLESSLEYHSKALTLARRLNDTNGVASGLYAIGEVHRSMSEHQLALQYFRDALDLDKKSGSVKNIAYSHNKVGITLLALERYKQARFHLSRSRDLFIQLKTPRDIQWAKSNLGKLALAQGDVAGARQTLAAVLEESLRGEWPVMINRTRIALAEADLAAGEHDSAIAHLEPALQDTLAQQALRTALRIYRLQADVYEAAGQPVAALEALRRGYALEHELFDAARTSVLAVMQGEARFEQQANALRLAKQERQLSVLALEREETFRLGGLLTLLAIFVVALLIFGRLLAYRQNKRLSLEVHAKTRELRERNDDLERAYAAVDRASITDPLTGLANRRFLERHIDSDVAQSVRQHRNTKPGETLTESDHVFFIIDLDYFKSINDREGHHAGDEVLVQFSRLLEEQFRRGDIVLRWGGEEFLVVARFMDRRRAADIAERLREKVASHSFRINGGRELQATCSIGFAPFPLLPERPDAVSWQETVELADQALYSVKQGPRNGWAGWSAQSHAKPKAPLAEWVHQALQAGELRTERSFDQAI